MAYSPPATQSSVPDNYHLADRLQTLWAHRQQPSLSPVLCQSIERKATDSRGTPPRRIAPTIVTSQQHHGRVSLGLLRTSDRRLTFPHALCKHATKRRSRVSARRLFLDVVAGPGLRLRIEGRATYYGIALTLQHRLAGLAANWSRIKESRLFGHYETVGGAHDTNRPSFHRRLFAIKNILGTIPSTSAPSIPHSPGLTRVCRSTIITLLVLPLRVLLGTTSPGNFPPSSFSQIIISHSQSSGNFQLDQTLSLRTDS
jgi:hypothetical protein